MDNPYSRHDCFRPDARCMVYQVPGCYSKNVSICIETLRVHICPQDIRQCPCRVEYPQESRTVCAFTGCSKRTDVLNDTFIPRGHDKGGSSYSQALRNLGKELAAASEDSQVKKTKWHRQREADARYIFKSLVYGEDRIQLNQKRMRTFEVTVDNVLKRYLESRIDSSSPICLLNIYSLLMSIYSDYRMYDVDMKEVHQTIKEHDLENRFVDTCIRLWKTVTQVSPSSRGKSQRKGYHFFHHCVVVAFNLVRKPDKRFLIEGIEYWPSLVPLLPKPVDLDDISKRHRVFQTKKVLSRKAFTHHDKELRLRLGTLIHSHQQHKKQLEVKRRLNISTRKRQKLGRGGGFKGWNLSVDKLLGRE